MTLSIPRSAHIIAHIPERILVRLNNKEIEELLLSLDPIITPTQTLQKHGIINDKTFTPTETGNNNQPVRTFSFFTRKAIQNQQANGTIHPRAAETGTE